MNVLIGSFFHRHALIYSEGNDTFPNSTFTLKKLRLQEKKKKLNTVLCCFNSEEYQLS